MARLAVSAVDAMMAERPDRTLEPALDVFEVFASGSLTDEVYIPQDVGGKRIAIAPTAVRDQHRRGRAKGLHRLPPPDEVGRGPACDGRRRRGRPPLKPP